MFGLAMGLAACGGNEFDLGSDVSQVDPGGFGDSGGIGDGDFGATQGGVQDIGLARTLVAEGVVPPASAFAVEGMFSEHDFCLLYTSPSPRDATLSRMPSSA